MAFDPFGDFEERGYLRNHAGQKDPAKVKALEHNSFARNVREALSNLDAKERISFQDIRDTHRTLFQDVYPWAGESRDQNAADLHVTKGAVQFQPAPYVPQGVDYALQTANNRQAFRADPGNTIGEIAFAHPFLDGNGRTLTTVVDSLAREADFHIAWEETNKRDYLTALTQEIDEPGKKHLTAYLEPYIRQGARSLDDIARTLTSVPGLSAPEQKRDLSQTALKAAHEVKEDQPTLFLVAGPNGAGKSTLTASGRFEGVKVIDPDAIQRKAGNASPEGSIEAFREAVNQQRQSIRNGESFAVETTLAGRNGLQLIDAAKQAGFRVELHFVGVNDVADSHQRVFDRVRSGGHDIPSDTIERRFPKVFEHLPEAIERADRTVLYDNQNKDHRLVGELTRENFKFEDNPPKWATRAAVESVKIEFAEPTTDLQFERAQARVVQAVQAAGVNEVQAQQISDRLAQQREVQLQAHSQPTQNNTYRR